MPNHVINKDAPSEEKDALVIEYVWGGETGTGNKNAVAKFSHDTQTDRKKYWLKKQAGRLFNPLSPTYNEAKNGPQSCEYRSVTEVAFHHYLAFINPNHNLAHLRNAERS